MTSDNRRVEIDAALLGHIKSKARWLERTNAVAGMDRDDFEQDLLLDLWRRRDAFDERRSPFGAFARLLTAHRAASLAAPTARCQAERRTVSLSTPLPGVEAGSLADLLSTDWQTEAAGHDLALDVRRFVASLTPAMQRCCGALVSGSVSDAAAGLGLNRSSIYETIARIRRHAAAAGLDAYIRAPDTSLPAPVSGSAESAERADGQPGSGGCLPEPAATRREMGCESTQPRAVALAADRAGLRQDRHQGQVSEVGHRGVRGSESARFRYRRDSAAAAAMSDPERNVHFRRRWSETVVQQHVTTREDRARQPLDEADHTIQDEWRRGRFVRRGGVR